MIRYDYQPTQSESTPGASAGYYAPGPGPSAPNDANAEQLKERALKKRDEMTEAVKTRASNYFEEQKSRLAGVIDDLSACTRHCVEEIQQRSHPQVGRAVDALAGGMDTLGRTLKEKDLSYFIDRTQDLARRRPGWFLGGTLALGFLAVRFLKSANPDSGSVPRHSDAEPRIPEGIHNDIPAGSGSQYVV